MPPFPEAEAAAGPGPDADGAERAGNGGAIPDWEGGITTPPPGFQPGHAHVDPFADDQVQFTITPTTSTTTPST